MIYHGAGKYEKPDEYGLEARMFETEDGHCRVCGKSMYVGGGESYDADGRLAERIEADFEKNCECGFADLDQDVVAPWRTIDSYGERLLNWLSGFERLDWIDEDDVCRMSEMAGKTFKELMTWDARSLLLLHAKAYADYVERMVFKGER